MNRLKLMRIIPNKNWLQKFRNRLETRWKNEYSQIAIDEMVHDASVGPSFLYIRFKDNPEAAADDDAMYAE